MGECPIDDPQHLRGWLLAKAMEAVSSLHEAIELAREAEAFLCGSPYSQGSTISPAVGRSGAVGPTGVPLEYSAKAVNGHHASAAPDLMDSLTALVSLDDVVRYLQQKHTVRSVEQDRYLIDDQVRETADQLVERANQERRSEKLPCFMLMPIATGSERGPASNRPTASSVVKTSPAERVAAEKSKTTGKGIAPAVLAPWPGCDVHGRALTADHPRFS
jgi:hypothetical protein